MKHQVHRRAAAEGVVRARLWINAREPAAQPVVAGVLHHVEERRRGDAGGNGVASDAWRRCGWRREQNGFCRDRKLRCKSKFRSSTTRKVARRQPVVVRGKWGERPPDSLSAMVCTDRKSTRLNSSHL